MLKNYLKLALKVLARRKFFTFISLFGISFTLMVLMIIAAFIQNEIGANAPLSRNKDMVFIPGISLLYYGNDTIRNVDTTVTNGITKYDTTIQVKRQENASSINNSNASFRVLDRHLKGLNGAEQTTFFAPGMTYDVYINNTKLTIHASLTDENYWKVFDFDFIQGKPYSIDEIKRGEQTVVITERFGKKYFGNTSDLVNKEIEMDDKHFKISGVVATPTNSAHYINSDLFMPYSVYPEKGDPLEYFGAYMAVFLNKKNNDINNLKKEIDNRTSRIPILKPEDYNSIDLEPATFSEAYAQRAMYDEDPAVSKRNLFLFLASFISLFALLPVLNLINLNISRIMDRSSEIGVRKAFGANTNNILFQFVFENIILTFIGGILGFIFALTAIYLINNGQLLDNIRLAVNVQFFVICFLICLVFGILSGILPALKMSKLSIVNALKQNNI